MGVHVFLCSNNVVHCTANCPTLKKETEHHLKDSELTHINMEHYTLGASYCRQSRTHGGVGIFMHNTLSYSTINLSKFCNDYDLEACTIQLIIPPNIYNILCIYRSPTGNFTTFLMHLEAILTQLHTNASNLIVCGDINVNYLQESRNKSLLNSLLVSFNLHSAVNFPTRISNSSSTTIDNIFIDKYKNKDYSIIPISNGLSDHDAQIIHLHDIDIPTQQIKPSNKRSHYSPI